MPVSRIAIGYFFVTLTYKGRKYRYLIQKGKYGYNCSEIFLVAKNKVITLEWYPESRSLVGNAPADFVAILEKELRESEVF